MHFVVCLIVDLSVLLSAFERRQYPPPAQATCPHLKTLPFPRRDERERTYYLGTGLDLYCLFTSNRAWFAGGHSGAELLSDNERGWNSRFVAFAVVDRQQLAAYSLWGRWFCLIDPRNALHQKIIGTLRPQVDDQPSVDAGLTTRALLQKSARRDSASGTARLVLFAPFPHRSDLSKRVPRSSRFRSSRFAF